MVEYHGQVTDLYTIINILVEEKLVHIPLDNLQPCGLTIG